MQKTNVTSIDGQDIPEGAEKIRLGLEAEQFMASNVGRFLMGKAMREAAAAVKEIRSLDSNAKDFKQKYDGLQMTIERHEDLERWLNEAINEGNQAYSEYEQDYSEGE